MQGIEITLYNNKRHSLENKEEYEVVAGENNATTILVHFPEQYKEFSKRVDFKNIRGEKWSISLYTPEIRTKEYADNFDKLNFTFTLPSPVTVFGELEVQFIAYLADDEKTFVPFKLVRIYVENSIFYIKKEGSENPDLVVEANTYSKLALEVAQQTVDMVNKTKQIVDELTVSSSQIDCEAPMSVEITTNATTERKNIHFNIPAPKKGTSYRNKGAWSSTTEYINNDYYIDTVSVHGCTYYCKQTHKNQQPLDSQETTYWGILALKSTNVTIVDNLDSTNPAYVLSAKQGNVLKQQQATQDTEISNLKTTTTNQGNEITKIKNNTTIIANSNGGFSCGSGTTNGKGMQFKGFTLCDENGKIPVERLFDAIYPVGSVYISVNSTSPQTLFGGTWVQLQDRFLLGAGATYSNGSTGGSKDAIAVSHNHNISQNVGGTIGYGGWGTIYGNGYTSAPGDVSGNISMEENYNSGIGNWAGGGNAQRGRNVYARFRIPDLVMDSAGSSGVDKNMPPYLVVYMWKRTA